MIRQADSGAATNVQRYKCSIDVKPRQIGAASILVLLGLGAGHGY